MKQLNKIMLIAVVLLVTLTSGARKAYSQTLTGWYCTPPTCLLISTGIGYFSATMYITGTFTDGDVRTTKTASRTVHSNGCTQSATLTAYGDTTSNPLLGAGILAGAEGKQGGVTLIESQVVRFMYGNSGFTSPAPSVPCV